MIERPDLWASYIWPAYILTIGGMGALLVWAWTSMRNAEKRSDELETQMKLRAKTQRLWLVIGAMTALGGAGALAFSTLGDKATYFYAPSDLAGKAPPAEAIRLGGMVEKGSLVKAGQTVHFIVTDNAKTWPVTYTGILPDLFREGQGVIAEGRIDPASGVFTAETILAKHDEKYMPPEVAGAMRKTAGKVS